MPLHLATQGAGKKVLMGKNDNHIGQGDEYPWQTLSRVRFMS